MDELNSSVVEQEVAAPAQEEETVADNTPDTEEPTAEPETQEERPLSENNRWAISRRRAEEEAQKHVQGKIAEALAARDAEFARRFAGFVNPITGKPIQNEKDYFAALDAKARLGIQQRISQSGRVEPGDVETLINLRVNDALNAKEAEMQARVQAERNRAEGDRQLNEQIAELSKMDPSIKSFEDLLNMDNFSEFDALVRKGADLVSAYKAVNYDKAKAATAKAATQAAINSARGKSHLAPVGGGKADDSGLTTEDLEIWHRFGLSTKEAREYHKQFNK